MLKILKILAIACVAAIVPTSSLAERINTTISIDCNKELDLYETYGEIVLLTGVFGDSKHTLHFFVNVETGSWSFVSLNMAGIYCLLYYGDGLKPVIHSSREEQREKSY
jgi:hypothetical protein